MYIILYRFMYVIKIILIYQWAYHCTLHCIVCRQVTITILARYRFEMAHYGKMLLFNVNGSVLLLYTTPYCQQRHALSG